MHPPLQPSSFLVTQRFIFFNFLLFFLILSLLCNLPPLIQPLHRLPPLIPSCLATPHPSCLLQRIPPLYSHPLNPSSLVTHRFTHFNFLLLLLILFLVCNHFGLFNLLTLCILLCNILLFLPLLILLVFCNLFLLGILLL